MLSIKVLLVDDHEIMRDGLTSLLAKEMDISVVGAVNNGRDAITVSAELHPNVVVMDITMEGLNGIDATKQLIADFPGLRVIALSMHASRRYVSDMLAAGASGYLTKDSAFRDLAMAIRAVVEGRTYLSSTVSQIVVEDYVQRVSEGSPKTVTGPAKDLSSREREVLQLIAEGYATKEIAVMLHLSIKTVETHRRQIMHKLDIHSIAGLTIYAVREGLASLGE